MKIVKWLRDIYADRAPHYRSLSTEVRDLLKPRVESEGWFFYARVKELQSFALKVETGRVPNPAEMEDFFGCTIVVPTMREIRAAEELVCEIFECRRRRPSDDRRTHKRSASFVFDDLRLYVAWVSQSSGRLPLLVGTVFEVQIKTALQYAWGVATHDLVYKSGAASWSRERIAFQVKAMLEHAEIAIAEVDQLAKAPAIAKSDDSTKDVGYLIGELKDVWPAESLPSDLKRLAETLLEVLRSADIAASNFRPLVASEKARLGGLPTDLSPYALMVQALANAPEVDFETKFNRERVRTKIFVHSGMDLPVWMAGSHPRIVAAE